MTPRRWLILALGVLLVLGYALLGRSPRGRAPTVGAVVRRWLTCIDCSDSQLADVLRESSRQPTAILNVLGDALLKGVPAADSATFAQEERRNDSRIKEWRARHPSPDPVLPESTFVARSFRNFDRGWRLRAALALGKIGTPPARRILDSAAVVISDPTLRWALDRARDSVYVRDSIGP